MKHIFISIVLSVFCLSTLAVRDLSPDQEITNLLKNPSFDKQFQGWALTQKGGSLNVQTATDGSLEVLSEGCEFVLEQTLTNLPDGIYELQLDGYFSAEAMPQSTLHGSMICLNDMKNVFVSASDYTEEYPTNKVMAKPNDGRLTIKIVGRCLASLYDVTNFSNLHLFYRGSENEAFSKCTELLLDMRSNLITMSECHSTDITDYLQHPSCNASLMKSVRDEAYSSTYSNLISNLNYIGNLLDDVCESRAAYIHLMTNILQTENTANLLIANNLLTEQQYNAAKQVLNTAIEGYTKGSFSNKDVENKLKEIASLSGLPKFIDNFMQISTPTDLCSFSLLVNEGMRTLDAQLTTDIDMKGTNNFQPIGLYSNKDAECSDFQTHSYGGTFEGKGFQISNLTLGTAYEGGMFGRCYKAKIRNLGLENVSITCTGAQTCGALAGTVMQTQVDNCYVVGNIKVTTDGKTVAHFVGEGAWNSIFNNCYTLGNDFTNASVAELNNCYWGNDATQIAPTGELCYSLNNGETTNAIYFQTIGKDAYPVLKSDHEIVRRSKEGDYYNGEDPDAIISVENSQLSNLNSQQPMYDLSGRHLSRKPQTGLYIQGGKVRR